MKRWRVPRIAGLLAGLVAGAFSPLAWDAWALAHPPFDPQYAVNAIQIKAIGEAIQRYEADKGERPMCLEDIVDAGMLEKAALYDRKRLQLASQPDVVYFPAVQKDDPRDMVLLCTFMLPKRDAPYLVIYNDGTFRKCSGVQLVTALNHTYRHISTAIAR